MVSKNYKKIAEEIRLGVREIGRKANVSHVTVLRVLAGKDEPFYSDDTVKRIHAIIDAEAAALMKNLNRLMGPAGD